MNSKSVSLVLKCIEGLGYLRMNTEHFLEAQAGDDITILRMKDICDKLLVATNSLAEAVGHQEYARPVVVQGLGLLARLGTDATWSPQEQMAAQSALEWANDALIARGREYCTTVHCSAGDDDLFGPPACGDGPPWKLDSISHVPIRGHSLGVGGGIFEDVGVAIGEPDRVATVVTWVRG